MEKLNGLSMDIEQTEREKLRAIFPECFTEGKLDIDKLLNMCGEYITDDFERYEFKWKGKSECLQLAQQRSNGTLRPCPEESVNFDSTQNLYIEGDNLEVLKLLQTSYYRSVKMIYIDPPYNTGNDFVYEDDFADPLARYKEVTGQTTKSNPESMGRFHTNWLNMMYPRLRLAANLLRDDGVIFISIDDNEVHNLRKVCDEVFGEENFVGVFVWKRRTGAMDSVNNVSTDHEYVLSYSKSLLSLVGLSRTFEKYNNPDNDPRGPWIADNLTAAKPGGNTHYEIENPATGQKYWPPKGRFWPYNPDTMKTKIVEGRIIFPAKEFGVPMLKRFKLEAKSMVQPISTWLATSSEKTSNENGIKQLQVGITSEGTKLIKELFEDKLFNYAKPLSLLTTFIQQATSTIAPKEPDIILDFFSGSATAAHAVMQLNAEDGGNRRFIMVQLPELCGENSEAFKAGYKNICEIGKERIRRAGTRLSVEGRGYSVELKAEDKKLIENEKKKAKTDAQLSLMENTSPNSTLSTLHSTLDLGFKVFKLDTSNLKMWDATPVADDNLLSLANRMNSMIDRVKPDRSDMDVVYEIMLKLGVPLTYSVTKMDVGGGSPAGSKPAYSIGDDCLLLVCLAPGITPEIIEQMAEYAPAKIILAEYGFTDDTAMSNAHYILQDRGIELDLV